MRVNVSSGMAAIQLILTLFRPGDELIVPEDCSGGTYRLLEQISMLFNRTTYTEFVDVNETEKLINSKTKALFIGTLTNPLMQSWILVCTRNLLGNTVYLLIVDNTFLTPYFQRPIELGADIVMHSATKYFGGHNDVLAGLVVAKGEKLCEQLAVNHNAIGESSPLPIRG